MVRIPTRQLGAGLSFSMGRTAVVDAATVTIVFTERAALPFHRENLTIAGNDPATPILVAMGASPGRPHTTTWRRR